jgi:hypothetical protein
VNATTRPILSPAIEQALARVASELARGSPRQATLDVTLAELDRLPPEASTRAEARIANAAGLYRDAMAVRPRGSWLRPLSRLGPKIVALEGAEYLCLFHRNGFLREQALHRLDGGLRSPFFFAAVAYRLNDWVPQVRHAAHACAMRTFPRTDPHIIVEAAIFLLDRRQSWRRWDVEAACSTRR